MAHTSLRLERMDKEASKGEAQAGGIGTVVVGRVWREPVTSVIQMMGTQTVKKYSQVLWLLIEVNVDSGHSVRTITASDSSGILLARFRVVRVECTYCQ